MPINLDPVVAAGNTLSYTENQPAATISPLAVVTDADSADFNGGSLTVSLGASSTADDFLALIDQGTGTGQIGVSGSGITYQGATIGTFTGGFINTDLVVTFTTADATPEAVQALLRDVHYGNISDDPSTADRTVTYTVTDGDGGTGTGTATITVAAVNDAPVNNIPLDQTVTEDTDLEFSVARGTAIVVADPDAHGGQETVTLQVQHGTLTLATEAGLVGVSGDGTNSVAFTGTLADINHALDGLIYRAAANYNGPDQFEIITNDNGNSGGPAQQDDDTIGITVIPMLDAPTDITGALAVNELAANGTLVGTLSTQDPDSNSFTYALLDDAGGRFSIDAATGQVHVVNGLLLDFEQNATHDITVRSTDSNNQFLDKVLTVTVNDVNPETVTGDGNANTFFGGALDDQLDGAGGNDTLRGNGGSNTLIGGAGFDTADYAGAPSGIYFDFAYGKAFFNGFGGTDTISGIENVRGSTHDDVFGSGPGDHTIDGDGGNRDAVSYANAPGAIIINLAAGTGHNGFGGTDTLLHIETVLGSAFDDNITGDAGNNYILGDGGADIMAGGLGDDTYEVDNQHDQVIENPGAGTDAVHSRLASYTLGDNVESLKLIGSAISGVGNAAANAIEGNALNNFIDGKGGGDLMVGGDGNDTYIVDSSGDVVIEEGDSEGPPSESPGAGQNSFDGPNPFDASAAAHGIDAVWAFTSYTLADNVEILVLGGNDNINGTGNILDNTIIGNNGNNIIDGAFGSDSMTGLGGDDTYFVDQIGDRVVEAAGQGTDTIKSTVSIGLADNVENLDLIGFGNINGLGNSLDNHITGNDGNNWIDGGAGADTLTGGAGNDLFIFGPGQANGDIVTDFTGNGPAAGDLLMFSGYGAGATFTQNDATHWQVNYNGGTQHDIITFSNAAIIDPNDFFFV